VDGLSRLEDAVDREEKAGKDVLKNPNDVPANKKLKAATNDVEKALQDVTNSLLNRNPNWDTDAYRYEDDDDDLDDESEDDLPPYEDDLDSIVPPPDDESPL